MLTPVLEIDLVNLLFWKRPPEPNRQGFRTQLESLSQDLRRGLGDIHDTVLSAELLKDLNTIESAYVGDLRKLQRPAN